MAATSTDSQKGGILLIWNPATYFELYGDWGGMLEELAENGECPSGWSCSHVKNIPVGTRAYLLKVGTGSRGIVAAGYTTAPVRVNHYEWGNQIDVTWDFLVDDPDEPISRESLIEATKGKFPKQVMFSGFGISAEMVAQIDHLLQLDEIPDEPTGGGSGQSLIQNALIKQRIEEYAQQRVEQHFRDQGWEVTDTHTDYPYDAIGIHGDHTIYIEAKGTQGEGLEVFVTKNEVEHARSNQGKCFIGIVNGIKVDSTGQIISGSGTLTIKPWNPDSGHLTPIQYRWSPA